MLPRKRNRVYAELALREGAAWAHHEDEPFANLLAAISRVLKGPDNVDELLDSQETVADADAPEQKTEPSHFQNA